MRRTSAARKGDPSRPRGFREARRTPPSSTNQPVKRRAPGKTEETLVPLTRKNVRTPDQTMGDLYAQIVALDVMEDRLRVLMDGYGLDDLTDLAPAIHGRCATP